MLFHFSNAAVSIKKLPKQFKKIDDRNYNEQGFNKAQGKMVEKMKDQQNQQKNKIAE